MAQPNTQYNYHDGGFILVRNSAVLQTLAEAANSETLKSACYSGHYRLTVISNCLHDLLTKLLLITVIGHLCNPFLRFSLLVFS